ncbi:MAG: bifunctional metallophosphatase/5'-nucleotidase [Candidatus Sumerlaeia bacterium]|nr:bifunctional metallophosphatase/5'-nucleotidase [Candidatus Sumerlaeia bacterium]
MKLTRRNFLAAGALTVGGMAAGFPVALPARPASALRLVVLHTNDVHSHLEPMNRGPNRGLGGAPARSAFINRMREKHKHVLLLDGGDILQGTPYFNLYGGEAEFLAMNHVKYDAGTIGNHEFDNGVEHLGMLIRDKAKFPFLNCNYGTEGTPLEGLTREYLIVEKEGLRIGLMGLGIRLEGLVSPEHFGDVQYHDPVENARRVARILHNDENCDFIICLSHINLMARHERDHGNEPGDRDVVAEVPEIDVVVGGHNHIFMGHPEVRFRGRGAGPGYVLQAGWGGTHIGMAQFDVYGRGKRELVQGGLCGVENATA